MSWVPEIGCHTRGTSAEEGDRSGVLSRHGNRKLTSKEAKSQDASLWETVEVDVEGRFGPLDVWNKCAFFWFHSSGLHRRHHSSSLLLCCHPLGT